MNIEDEYQDVLQNIEFAIINIYHRHPNLLDYDVETVLSALLRYYKAEQRNRQPPTIPLTELRQELYDSIKGMCDWRLGREELTRQTEKTTLPNPAPISLAEMIVCLKRIRKSVKTWSKKGGRQGYLTFVEQFIR